MFVPNKKVDANVTDSQWKTFDFGMGARLLSNITEKASQYATSAFAANLTPGQDPNTKLVGYATSFNNTGHICMGRVMDGSAELHGYRVDVENLKTPVMALTLSHNSSTVIGATDISTLAPGTGVLLWLHNSLGWGFILGAYADATLTGDEASHDYISQTTRKRVDDAHKKLYYLPEGSRAVDWSAYKPVDSTLASDWGASSTTGLRVTLDDFMVQLAVNEFTGIFGFYHDQLLRVGGYNYQCWTAGSEREGMLDQAEYNDYQGYAPYGWEGAGLLRPGVDQVMEVKPDAYLCPTSRPYWGFWENKQEFQQPFHRTQEFYGYYGQGRRVVVCAPPTGIDFWTLKPGKSNSPETPFITEVASDKDAKKPPCDSAPDKTPVFEQKPPYGFHEDNIAVDGRRFIASAKGIVLSKRMLIPIPTRIRRPEDGSGDKAEDNYKSAGKYGSGPEHKITGDIESTNSTWPNLQRACAVLDLHGYLFNYAGLHPFHWHYKDYRTWEQQDLEYAKNNHTIPQYSSLKGSMYLSETEFDTQDIEVDHRYKTQKFFESECFISLLEDGAVVLGDGYGGEIRMCAGVVQISAPGDVWLKAGRNVQAWAGHDAIVRAKDSVDISSTEKNVRIKAEQNAMIFAGNETSKKQGGILLESRAKAPSYIFKEPGDKVIFGGIVMKAKDAEIVGLSRDIYLRTVGGSSGLGGRGGVITLDAARGEGEILTKSKNLFNYVQRTGGVFHVFGNEGGGLGGALLGALDAAMGKVDVVNYFTRKFSLINGPIYTDKNIVADGPIMTRGSFITNKGHIFTRKGGPAVPCAGECSGGVNEAVQKITDLINKDLPEILEKVDKESWKPLWYNAQRPGNDAVIKEIEFSFRTDDDYNVKDFELFEDRWQQMAREAGQKLDKWEEKPVKVIAGTSTFPFPGLANFKKIGGFKTQSWNIVEKSGKGLRDKKRLSSNGESKAELAPEYKEPKFKDTESATLLDGYIIVGGN
jgi:hypothetical protein